MTLEAGKEMDRRCVLNWLKEVYVMPSRAFDEYTEDELKIFVHDALILLKEQEKIVRCKDCLRRGTYDCPVYIGGDGMCSEPDDWYCADGERR